MSCSIRISVIAAVEREQQLGQALALAAREPGGRLVEHHQLRIGGARHADLELALLAVGERADQRRRASRSRPTARGQLAGALAQLARRAPRRRRRRWPVALPSDREVEVVLDRQAGERAATSGTCAPMPSWARTRGGQARSTSWPINSIVPLVGGKSPAMTLNSVVLPAPFGPRMARRSPCATSRSTSRTACTPPKRRPTPRRRRIGSACLGAALPPSARLAGDQFGLTRLAYPGHVPLDARRVRPPGGGVESAERRRRTSGRRPGRRRPS